MPVPGENKSGLIATLTGEPSPEVNSLIAMGEVLYFQIGDVICSEGQKMDHICDLVSGTVSIARNGRDGRRQILAFVGGRLFFGGASTSYYPNSVMALTPVCILRYPKTALEKALEASADFNKNFRQALVQIIESRDDHIFTIGQRNSVERLASFLVHLQLNQARFESGGSAILETEINLPMSRIDIADYLGLTVETVSRAFASLRDMGMITFEDANTCNIVDLNRLLEYGGRDDLTQYRGEAPTD